ncbi:TetR/AcrR family transcriptional regulator [Paenibacillus ehimensis]|uniref:TetR family transcriptional regulator C-terminal domain-containing protein n=1 Tax=Paenibacillus ehimensis TaxID=79264 RepID=A0ABT8VFB0_9BACL|nr:TetR/AcrR family transcriptional regulator [Paenibacillus ehimensis]MDO3679669.1 TetR family transcriptional regulator C-terminal domain-containing protein [Paenibacillus ehimensis]MEC0211934.1 TetR family transcriptional regulator C-terminal domain-containing protein [Paenibacillus ehimensis]
MARKRPEEAEQTRKHILATAKELFVQKGYSATSIDEIRVKSGMSKGSIYYHFKSKESLFLKLLDENMQEWIDQWSKLSASLTTETERLYALADHFALDLQNPLMKAAEEFSGSQTADPDILNYLVALAKTPHQHVKNVLQAGMDKGEFKKDDPEQLTFIVMGTLGGLSATYYENYTMDQLIAIHRKAIDTILNGIRPD